MGATIYLMIIYLFLFVADILAFIKGKETKKNDTFYSNYNDNN